MRFLAIRPRNDPDLPQMVARVFSKTPAFARFVFALDERLRGRSAVFDFVEQSDCILRIQFESPRAGWAPSDGPLLGPGERVVNLHWRNEHFPPALRDGREFGRLLALARQFEASLRSLAAYLDASPDFDDVVLIRAVMPWRRSRPLICIERVASGFGFRTAAEPSPRRLLARLHRQGENILILLLLLACNPSAANLSYLVSDRIALLMPREILDRMYGPLRDPTARTWPRTGRAQELRRSVNAA